MPGLNYIFIISFKTLMLVRFWCCRAMLCRQRYCYANVVCPYVHNVRPSVRLSSTIYGRECNIWTCTQNCKCLPAAAKPK